MKGIALLCVLVLAMPGFALARGHGSHGSGLSHGRSHSGIHVRRGGGRVYAFRTSACKRSSCFAKHPGGTYVHPLTSRKYR